MQRDLLPLLLEVLFRRLDQSRGLTIVYCFSLLVVDVSLPPPLPPPPAVAAIVVVNLATVVIAVVVIVALIVALTLAAR